MASKDSIEGHPSSVLSQPKQPMYFNMQWDESHETEGSTDICDMGLNLYSSD